MNKIIINVIFLLALSSCFNFNFNNGDEPRKKAFKYYNKNFQIDSKCKLKLDKQYIKLDAVDYNTTSILTFYYDGFMNYKSIGNFSGSYLPRRNEGIVLGYFKTNLDSIFFTTKSYYNRKEHYFCGRIFSDSIILSSWKLNWKKKKVNIMENQVYILQQ